MSLEKTLVIISSRSKNIIKKICLYSYYYYIVTDKKHLLKLSLVLTYKKNKKPFNGSTLPLIYGDRGKAKKKTLNSKDGK